MSLNIKNEEAEALARRVAEITGESVTQAVASALKERLAHLESARQKLAEERIERIRRIASGSGDLWIEPYRSTPHGDLLYDEEGLPK